MQPQLILRVAGIAALVIAALFAVLAVHYYLTQNIRAVMDDLSGKTRARGVAGARTRTSADSRRGGSRKASRQAGAPTSGSVDAAQPVPASDAPRRAEVAPAAQPSAAALAFDEDDAGTVLVGAVHAGETEAATQGAPAPAAQPTSQDSQSLFRMTRSIVLIHSQEVIATSEEPFV